MKMISILILLMMMAMMINLAKASTWEEIYEFNFSQISNEQPTVRYTFGSKIIEYSDGSGIVKLGQLYADRNGTKVEDAKSLKDCEFCNDNIRMLVSPDKNHEVYIDNRKYGKCNDKNNCTKITILDYNYTTLKGIINSTLIGRNITIKTISKQLNETDLKVEEKKRYEDSINFKDIKEQKEVIIPFYDGDEIHFGESSTILTLDYNDVVWDSYVYENAADTNYGSATVLTVRSQTTIDDIAYLMYDISSIPSGKIIESAWLSMYCYLYFDTALPINMSAYHIFDSTWDGQTESTITWNNQVCGTAFNDAADCNLTPMYDDKKNSVGWWNWSIISGINYEYSRNNNNISIAIAALPLSAADSYLCLYNSSEANGATHYITIAYSEQDTTPPVITNLRNLSTTNSSTYINWTTDENANATLTYGICPSITGTTKTDNSLALNRGFILTGLTNGTSYCLNASSCDINKNCGYNSTFSFITALNVEKSTIPTFSNNKTNATSTTKLFTDVQLNLTITSTGTIHSYILSHNSTKIDAHCGPPPSAECNGVDEETCDLFGCTWYPETYGWVNTSPIYANTDKAVMLFNLSLNTFMEEGGIVGWQVWANDTAGNVNISDIYTFLVNYSYCGILDENGTILNLDKDEESPGTCYVVTAYNATIQCKGYMITFGEKLNGTYGITSTGNETKIMNCNITDTQNSINKNSIFLDGSRSTIITNSTIKTIGNFSVAVNIQNSDNLQFDLNKIITSGSGSEAIHTNGMNQNITRNIVTTYGQAAHGFYISYSDFSRIINNTVELNGYKAYGMPLTSSHNILVDGLNIKTSGPEGHGIYFHDHEDNITIQNSIVSTINSGSAIELEMDGYNFTAIDTILNSTYTGTPDFNISYTTKSGNWTLINVTRPSGEKINITWEQSGNGTLNVGWWLTINSTPTSSISSIYDNSLEFKGNITTPDKKALLEYTTTDITSTSYYSNYTVNVSKAGYITSTNKINLTGNTFLNVVLSAQEAGSCDCPSGTDWHILCSDNCDLPTCDITGYNLFIDGTSGHVSIYNDLYVNDIFWELGCDIYYDINKIHKQ